MSGGHGAGAAGGVEAVAAGASPVHRLDPRVKIVGLIGLVVVAATTAVGAWGALVAYLAVAVVLAAAARLPLRYTLRRMVVEVPFLLAALALPFLADDGAARGATLALKLTTSVLAMVVLSSTTPFPRLLRGFEALRAPRVLVLIVSFMWRYLHVLGDEAARMRTARTARGDDSRWLWQAASVGAMMATLFVRALERGERVYLAMTSRGFTGAMPATLGDELVLRRVDVAFAASLAAAVMGARVLL